MANKKAARNAFADSVMDGCYLSAGDLSVATSPRCGVQGNTGFEARKAERIPKQTEPMFPLGCAVTASAERTPHPVQPTHVAIRRRAGRYKQQRVTPGNTHQ
ncbi:hypothetical protein [Xanthomonas arboricola]|uniref:hypothetical protein n=1 Tax=Xanthomonas arboricola TaxID=56448 RepID=UPI0015E28771|nr:hypothetical protein [Xanthomonas arboricola]